MNYQDCGYTRQYYNNIPSWVRYVDQHSSSTYTKSKDLPEKCVLYFGGHQANYQGCQSKNQSNHAYEVNKNHLDQNIRCHGNNTNVPTHSSPKITSENQNTPTTILSHA